jgi:predicted dehydrogenase
MSDVRFALIGCGRISQLHAENLQSLLGRPDVLVGACDSLLDRAEAMTAHAGGRAYTDAAAMLDAEKPDAVIICTPPFVREDPIAACCERGVPFLCEKPPASDWDAARRIADIVGDAGVLHSVAFMYRYHLGSDEYHRWMTGRTPAVVVSAFGCGPLYDPDFPPWFKLMERSGGPIMDQAIHSFDTIRYLVGDITEVHAFGSNLHFPLADDMTVPESAAITFRFASGAIGTHYHSWADKLWIGQIDVRTGDDRVLMQIGDGTLTGTMDGAERSFSESGPPHRRELEYFVKALETGDASLVRSTYADAAKTLAVCLAANKSILTGEPQSVPTL